MSVNACENRKERREEKLFFFLCVSEEINSFLYLAKKKGCRSVRSETIGHSQIDDYSEARGQQPSYYNGVEHRGIRGRECSDRDEGYRQGWRSYSAHRFGRRSGKLVRFLMYSFFSRSDIKRVFIFFSRNESNCGCVLYFYIDFSNSR